MIPLQEAQILVALQAVPLDRIRLMKTLFLIWYRAGQPATGPFQFEPYLYGPCAFDLYRALDEIEGGGLIVQTPEPFGRHGRYFLTETGKTKVASQRLLDDEQCRQIASVARWAANQNFRSLLNQVYKEAPEFASRSVLHR
ncbi:hypothetical protein MYX78_03690 [Acidobacteria bacterium AH-259-G07]|nr:hypothetical protein [Acidobacteria bacterium AH-259-G07]